MLVTAPCKHDTDLHTARGSLLRHAKLSHDAVKTIIGKHRNIDTTGAAKHAVIYKTPAFMIVHVKSVHTTGDVLFAMPQYNFSQLQGSVTHGRRSINW